MRDNLFALSQVTIFASSLLAIQIKVVGIPMRTKVICIINKQQRLNQTRDIRRIVYVNNEKEDAQGLTPVARHTKYSYSKIDGTQTGQIESYSQDSF